ncbi:MAG: glycosyltransferase family 4 protein, partial [Terracidiphilus sp.]
MPRCVLIVRQAYYPENLRFQDQAQHLAAHGSEVVVLSLRRPNQPTREVLNGVTVHRVPMSWVRRGPVIYAIQYLLFCLVAFGFLSLYSIRRRVLAVLVSNLPDILVFCALVPKIMGARVVLDIRDPMPETLATRYSLNQTGVLYRLAVLEEQISCAFADGVLSVHEPILRLLEKRGVPTRKLWVLYNLPDPAEFYPRRDRTPRTGERSGPNLVFHGTIANRFGIDTVIKAVCYLRESFPAVRLSIFGEGEALPYLRQFARDQGVDDRVTFHGFQSASVISQALSKADMGIIPHLRTPGMDIVLPTKLLECMSCGLPAIVTRNPVMEELVPEDAVRFFVAGDTAAL